MKGYLLCPLSDVEKFCFYLHYFNNKSNGIVVSWEAAHQFSQLGHDVKVVTYGDLNFATPLPTQFNKLLGREFEGDEIAIYPDAVVNNPLNASKVSRFLLAKPYLLDGRQIEFGPNDFVFSYSKAVLDKPPYLTLLNPELLNLQAKYSTTKENQVLLYFGKVRFGALDIAPLKQLIRGFDNCRIITRTQPAEASQLYGEFARSRLLISFDPLTNLGLEATLLDTPVLIADPIFKPQYEDFNFKLHGFFYSPEDFYSAQYEVRKANQEIQVHFNHQSEIVKKLIHEMVSHFQNIPPKNNQTFIDFINTSSQSFYENSWNKFPIFNILNFKFLMVYLIFCDCLKFYVALRTVYRAIIRPSRSLKKFFYSIVNLKEYKSSRVIGVHFQKSFQERLSLYLLLRKK